MESSKGLNHFSYNKIDQVLLSNSLKYEKVFDQYEDKKLNSFLQFIFKDVLIIIRKYRLNSVCLHKKLLFFNQNFVH
ncbi:hypothetical protein ASE40_10835 [Flavobacterium sp. Root935]|nr:hypothetical protein ASE40_10835 [Flavobacterium sp. Root935]BDU25028.1 hypothetical protein FLGSB24_17720 [Flavobacterium sp. GSB-24]